MKNRIGLLLSGLFLLCAATTVAWGWSHKGKKRVSIKNCHDKKIKVSSYNSGDKTFGDASFSTKYIGVGKTASLKCRSKRCNLKVENHNVRGKHKTYTKKKGNYTVFKGGKDKPWQLKSGHLSCTK